VFARILVATDGSSTARSAVDRAAEVARRTGGTLTVLCAAPLAKAEAVVEAERARLAETGLAVETAVAAGDPATAIVETAEAGRYDLVVIGNKGMTGARRYFTLGSVPNKVSHSLATSLLIVKTT
jgi:nucleotide-binding universal stress UspA family protein